MQQASKIIMIRSVKFGFNGQTAGSNSFQQSADKINSELIQQHAQQEFDAFAEKLKMKGIDVIIFEDTLSPPAPDSIFPNNWISFHENNTMVIYPMLAENRRLERRADIINIFKTKNTTLIDLTGFENAGRFLEGTGSIVFDRENRIAYAAISPRTDKLLVEDLCRQLNYTCITFRAVDTKGAAIYHTNVLITIGKGFAIVCEDCLPDKNELTTVIDALKKTDHEIITISYEQLNSFAGNMYQLFTNTGGSFIIMSEQAYSSLTTPQIKQLEQFGDLIFSPLYTIEKYGGGSARCMMLDVRC